MKIYCYSILLLSLFILSCSDNSEIDFRIIEIVPPSDGPGAKVEIAGKGFGESASGVSIFFNGTPAIITSFTDTLIITNVPEKATTGKLALYIGSESIESIDDFVILEGMWAEKDSIPFEYGFTGAVGFASEDKGYIGTGAWSPVAMNEFWCYHPTIDTWIEIDPMPSEELYFCTSFVIDDYAYVGLGKQSGIDPTNANFYRLDMKDNTWEEISKFPGIDNVARAVSFAIGSKGYVNRNNEVWEYNPDTDGWSRLNDFPGEPTDGAVGAAVGEFGYLGLGFSSGRTDWWQYNPTIDIWIQKSDCPDNRQTIWLSSFVMNDKIYLVGTGPRCWEYDPSLDLWTQRTSLPNMRFVPASFSINGKGYVGTGTSDGGWKQKDLWEFTLQ